jgi:hypothetical protein
VIWLVVVALAALAAAALLVPLMRHERAEASPADYDR